MGIAPSTKELHVKNPRKHTLAVWEFTLACNLKCRHCGSSAGKKRKDELSTNAALDVVRRLKDLGIKEVNLIGGEATLRPDWPVIGKAISDSGMALAFQTGGLHISPTILDQMVEIGTKGVGVSIDGVGDIHDNQRGVKGSYERALKTLDYLSDSKIPFLACTTQLNRLSFTSLLELLDKVSQTRVKSWQIAQTLPMGIGTSATDLHFQPSDFLVIHELAAIFSVEAWKRGILGIAANPLGYFGPYERLIRTGPHNINSFYQGCPAAKGVIGLEANGTIKGCPSLPTDPFSLGKSNESGFKKLETVFEISDSPYQNRINGFCADCPFSNVCWSGCGWSATTTMGQKGDNPYCMFRSIVNYGIAQYEQLEQQSEGDLGPFEYGINKLNLYQGKNNKTIQMNQIKIPEGMEETVQVFKEKRKNIVLSVQEIFNNFRKTNFSKDVNPLGMLKYMELSCIPYEYLREIGALTETSVKSKNINEKPN